MRKFLALVVLVVLLACYIGAEERRVYPVSAVVVDVDVDVIVAEDGSAISGVFTVAAGIVDGLSP